MESSQDPFFLIKREILKQKKLFFCHNFTSYLYVYSQEIQKLQPFCALEMQVKVTVFLSKTSTLIAVKAVKGTLF